ncbi:MAG: hypothetical protein ACRC1T_05130 [Clostridium chrysemydis]|uniref:hypothetical protein n=1 Tax=Clostridium chrysemydis TaxID=2665504 RepID=UPI003F3DF4F4
MCNLETSIANCIEEELKKGIIEKVIAKKLEECVESSVKDLFSWSGECKKVIENKIKSVMIPYLERYDYSEYITKLDQVLVEVLKSSALDNKKMTENFKELLTSEDVPKEIKITDIFKEWCKYCKKDIDKNKLVMDYEGAYINLNMNIEEVSSSWSSTKRYIVTFECEEDEELNKEFALNQWYSNGKSYIIYDRLNDLASLRNLGTFDMLLMRFSQSLSDIEIDKYSDSEEVYIEYGEE